jgi:hypothetical protein
VNTATARASRAAKQPPIVDLAARDVQRLAASATQDDQLLRRWERIAEEIARG